MGLFKLGQQPHTPFFPAWHLVSPTSSILSEKQIFYSVFQETFPYKDYKYSLNHFIF